MLADLINSVAQQTYASEFARSLGLDPDEHQYEVLDGDYNRLILNWSRQSGKSTTTAVKALHHAIYLLRSLVLLLSPSLRQSSELFRKVTDFMALMPSAPETTAQTMTSVDFANGSRIISLPGGEQTVRGYSAPSLVIIDEAALITPALYYSVRPMVATRPDATIMLLSTPHGRGGVFWETWERGGPEWRKIMVTADQCPRISQAFLDEERHTIGDRWFRQEYQCEFLELEGALFGAKLVGGLFDDIKHMHAGTLIDDSAKPFYRREE